MRTGWCTACTPERVGPQHGRGCPDWCSCDWHQGIPAKAATPTQAELNEDDPQTALAVAVEIAVRAGENLASASLAIGPDLSAEDALRRLHRLRQAIEQCQLVDAALVRHIYLNGEHGDVSLDGLPVAKVTRGRDRKSWDSRGAVFAYLDQRLSGADGELPDPMDVAAMVLDLVGVGYVRVTPLRSAGLDPDAFCDSSPGRLSVTFVE